LSWGHNTENTKQKNVRVVGDFNTPLSSIDRSSKQKINREILDLKYTIDQMDLVDVYRIFHPNSTQYTFFSEAHGTFSKIDHILGRKVSLIWKWGLPIYLLGLSLNGDHPDLNLPSTQDYRCEPPVSA
jgi:hypothetical protein